MISSLSTFYLFQIVASSVNIEETVKTLNSNNGSLCSLLVTSLKNKSSMRRYKSRQDVLLGNLVTSLIKSLHIQGNKYI